MFSRVHILLVAAVVVLAAGCSGSVDFSFGGQSAPEAAVDLIESESMVQRLMLDSITGATCEDPLANTPGTVFGCTADSMGEVIEFEVEIEPEDRIFATATNVVSATVIDQYGTTAVEALNSGNGFNLAEDAIDCGTESIVLDANRQMTCTLTDVPNGTEFGALLTVSDVNRGIFNVEIVAAEG